MKKFKNIKILSMILCTLILNINNINAKTKDDNKITEILPKAGNSISTYAPISEKLNSSIYNKTISIRVGNFSNDMDSVNIGLYVDGIFQISSERILAGNTADFAFPSNGEAYEIRMSTYSSAQGTCSYTVSIK